MVYRGPYSTQEPVECLGVPRAARDPYGACWGVPIKFWGSLQHLGVLRTPRGSLEHPRCCVMLGGPYSTQGAYSTQVAPIAAGGPQGA